MERDPHWLLMRRRLAAAANALLARFGVALVRRSAPEVPSAVPLGDRHAYRPTPLPPEAEERLRPDHPRLRELRARYAAFSSPVMTRSVWTDRLVSEIRLTHFRGDNPVVWQVRENSEAAYLLTAYYLRAHDPLRVLSAGDDELFGAFGFPAGGTGLVTRDLLDSAAEISFLERHLSLSGRPGLRVLDIGAGYGRLAHRLARSLPGLGPVVCADAVAEMTFLSEYYLGFRGVADRTAVVPIDGIEAAIAANPPELAVNVHSFSECPAGAVEWWIALLARHSVPRLFLVPTHNGRDHDGREPRTMEPDGGCRDLLPLLARYGYRRVALDPKYLDPGVMAHGVSPTWHHLFALDGRAGW